MSSVNTAHSVVEPSRTSKRIAATIVIAYAVITMIPLRMDRSDQLQIPSGFNQLSAENRISADAGGLLQPVHNAHAANLRVHRFAWRTDEYLR